MSTDESAPASTVGLLDMASEAEELVGVPVAIVLRHLEIIGEATVHLSETTRQAIPGLPFRKMRGMRNVAAHDDANVDLSVVWDVATVHVPWSAPPLSTTASNLVPVFVAPVSQSARGGSRNRDCTKAILDILEEPVRLAPP